MRSRSHSISPYQMIYIWYGYDIFDISYQMTHLFIRACVYFCVVFVDGSMYTTLVLTLCSISHVRGCLIRRGSVVRHEWGQVHEYVELWLLFCRAAQPQVLSVLQCVAGCCSVLQCAAVCCSMLQCVAVLWLPRLMRNPYAFNVLTLVLFVCDLCTRVLSSYWVREEQLLSRCMFHTQWRAWLLQRRRRKLIQLRNGRQQPGVPLGTCACECMHVNKLEYHRGKCILSGGYD